MPIPIAIPIAMGALSLISGMMKHKQSQNTTSTGTSTPSYGPEFQGIKDKLIANAMRSLSGGGGYSMAHNLTNQRLQAINAGGNAAQTGLAAKLASMGIRGGAAANPMARLAQSQFGAGVGATNDEPLLAHGFDMENLNQAMNVLGFGRGVSTTGVSNGTMEGGGGIGGGLEGLGGMLGFLYGHGAFNGLMGGKKSAAGGIGNLITPGGNTGGFGPGGGF